MSDETNQNTMPQGAETQLDEPRYSKSDIENIVQQRVKETKAELQRERQEKEALRQQMEASMAHGAAGGIQGALPNADWEKIIEQEVDKRADAKLEQKSNDEKIKSFSNEFNEASKQDDELLQLSQKGNRLSQDTVFAIAKMDYIPNKVAVLKDLLKDKGSADILESSSSLAEFKKNVKEISERLAKIAPGPSKYQSADKLSPTVSGAPDDEIDFVARARKKGY